MPECGPLTRCSFIWSLPDADIVCGQATSIGGYHLMRTRRRVPSVLFLIFPLMGFCCSDDCDSGTGPGNGESNSQADYDVTNDWAFSTYWSNNLVCTWHLELQMGSGGKITGNGKKGVQTIFVGGSDGVITTMFNHPVSGSVSGNSVSLNFDACDGSFHTFTGTVFSTGKMGGSNWVAEVVPQAPAAPTELDGTIINSNNDLKFSWKDNSDTETGFEWQRSHEQPLDPNDVYEGRLPPNSTSYTLRAVPLGAWIHFRVRAYRQAGKFGYKYSAWTPWRSGQVQ